MGPPPQDNDNLLAEKLRREDPEQYHTLIRMHLSFVLDLHTDECDSGTDKAKNRALKWNLLPFSKKSKPQSKGVMEGAPLTQEGICQVYQLIEFLSKEQNIKQEGIFRRSGKLKRQQELKSLLNQGVTLDLNDGRYSVHDCASVLKNFLAELPEPLLTDAHYQAHCQIADMCISGAESKSDGRLLRALQLLLLLLPPENRVLLSDLLSLLHLTASHQSSNRMSAESLATLFTPHLACPRKMPPEALHANAQLMSRVVAFLIRQGATPLFQIPPQLATDIRAYWARKESTGICPIKKVDGRSTLKGEKKVDGESAEVNTVFSFVDRERTAQEYSSNITEAALAQLYAHIRSLPESSEKRRLVKQFNKENGAGTPHQPYTRLMASRGKSFGDSIKRHLFNKGIKCPKAGVQQGYFSILHQNGGDKSNETMMTPRSRKPVLALSGSNISHVPSLHLCSQIQADVNDSACANRDQEKESSTGSKDFSRKESESQRSGSPFCDTNEKDKSISNENLSFSDDVKMDNGETESLTSTFINYLQSRSVLTASPIDLSCDEGSRPGSPVVLELVSLKSENQLSDSLLYCLDGNIPSSSPLASPAAQEMEKSTRESSKVSPEIQESHRKPRKRKSSEFQKESPILSNKGSPVIKIMPHKNCDNLDSDELASEDTPKNKSVIETSL